MGVLEPLSGYKTMMLSDGPILFGLIAALPAAWLADKTQSAIAHQDARPPLLWLAVGLGTIFVWAAMTRPPPIILTASLGLGWTLICLSIIDIATLRLPDLLTLPLLVAGLLISLVLPGRPIAEHMVGAAVGWGVLALIARGYSWARGAAGIGLGDAKLLGAAGAWLGWRDLASVVMIACATAFLWVALVGVARGRSALREPIAFGAPLSLAIWIVWLYGPLAL